MRARLIAAMAVALLMILAPAASASSDTGTVYVVHGVPGLTVDVYVNGDLTLEDFEPGTITDALELPAGSYDIEIFPADADAEAEDPAIAGSADLTAGANVSVVAHLDPDAQPVLGVFPNDVAPIEAGVALATVRHTAAVGPVDIAIDGDVLFEDVTNGEEGVLETGPPLTFDVTILNADTDLTVVGPAEVTLTEGANTILYAIGAEDGTLDVLVQVITGLSAPPSGIPSGTGGLKAAEDALAVQLPWVAGLAALIIVGAGVGARRARARH